MRILSRASPSDGPSPYRHLHTQVQPIKMSRSSIWPSAFEQAVCRLRSSCCTFFDAMGRHMSVHLNPSCLFRRSQWWARATHPPFRSTCSRISTTDTRSSGLLLVSCWASPYSLEASLLVRLHPFAARLTLRHSSSAPFGMGPGAAGSESARPVLTHWLHMRAGPDNITHHCSMGDTCKAARCTCDAVLQGLSST